MSSIYDENPWDHKLSIRENKELLENVILNNFNICDSSDSDEDIDTKVTQETALKQLNERLKIKNAKFEGDIRGLS